MRIVIATPLYPPDIADPAPYVKELAKRLTSNNTVVVVTYGHLVEKVPGVTVYGTNKRLPTPLRIFLFTIQLIATLRRNDILYIQSGASAELPSLIALLFKNVTILFRKRDEVRLSGKLKTAVRRLLLKKADVVETPDTLVRPEILPFMPHPEAALQSFESAWAAHVRYITTYENKG